MISDIDAKQGAIEKDNIRQAQMIPESNTGSGRELGIVLKIQDLSPLRKGLLKIK